MNINDLIPSNNQIKSSREALFANLVISSEKGCSIEVNESNSTNTTNDLAALFLSNSTNKKPLLEISFNENYQELNRTNANKQKRNNELDFLNSLCKVPMNVNDECCIVQYYIEFKTIFPKSFVIKPLGFAANYCFGKCSKCKFS